MASAHQQRATVAMTMARAHPTTDGRTSRAYDAELVLANGFGWLVGCLAG